MLPHSPYLMNVVERGKNEKEKAAESGETAQNKRR